VVPVPLWPRDQRQQYVEERVRIHQQAEFNHISGTPLPFCSDEERWKTADTFAVKKPQNKRARRVFSALEEAEAYLEGLDGNYAIETRLGEAKRCSMGYCPVANHCDQWQNELQGVAT
jgi:hypothetical protein